MTSWDGKERRNGHNDHDSLTKLIVLIEQHIRNFNEHRVIFGEHLTDDKRNFEILFKAYYGGVAVITLVIIFLKFLK